jgi:hypothetical protein
VTGRGYVAARRSTLEHGFLGFFRMVFCAIAIDLAYKAAAAQLTLADVPALGDAVCSLAFAFGLDAMMRRS